MFEEGSIKYFHPALNIGIQDIRNVWLLSVAPVKLTLSLHRGCLVFRLPGAGKRISYKVLKKVLIKKSIIIR
jgi:hypothetical protein